jgi:crossover junction endodeoxyribonuclease RuvC
VRVLGVDPGLGRCGWAVVEAGPPRARAVAYGTVTSRTAGQDVAPRLLELARRLRGVLAEHRPDCMAVERLFVNANVRTAMTVGQASGVVLLVAAEDGLPVASYTPSQVKQAVTGTGTAPKAQVGYMVRTLLRLDATPTPADTADALAVALCHLHFAGIAAGSANAPSGLAAAGAAAWLARAAPTSPGRGPGNPQGVPRGNRLDRVEGARP